MMSALGRTGWFAGRIDVLRTGPVVGWRLIDVGCAQRTGLPPGDVVADFALRLRDVGGLSRATVMSRAANIRSMAGVEISTAGAAGKLLIAAVVSTVGMTGFTGSGTTVAAPSPMSCRQNRRNNLFK